MSHPEGAGLETLLALSSLLIQNPKSVITNYELRIIEPAQPSRSTLGLIPNISGYHYHADYQDHHYWVEYMCLLNPENSLCGLLRCYCRH
jgi:hypothetical protein